MAFTTTHPNQLESRRGLRAGLIGLAFVALAAVAALGFSVVDYDSQVAPAVVKFPSNEPENQIIRDQVAAAGVEAPAVVKFPSNEPENQMIRDQVAAAGVEAPAVVKFPSNEPENQMIRDQVAAAGAAAAPASH